MFLCTRYTVSKYSDEDVHVNGIKIIQSINVAPGNVAALRCLQRLRSKSFLERFRTHLLRSKSKLMIE